MFIIHVAIIHVKIVHHLDCLLNRSLTEVLGGTATYDKDKEAGLEPSNLLSLQDGGETPTQAKKQGQSQIASTIAQALDPSSAELKREAPAVGPSAIHMDFKGHHEEPEEVRTPFLPTLPLKLYTFCCGFTLFLSLCMMLNLPDISWLCTYEGERINQ